MDGRIEDDQEEIEEMQEMGEMEGEDDEGMEEYDKEDDLNMAYYQGLQEMEALNLVDISNLAAWSVSSFKPGHGVKALQQDDANSFWQSDGGQPHYIDVHFSKRVSLQRVSLYTDFIADESYTPSKLALFCGTGYHDLQQVLTTQLSEPRGWVHLELSPLRPDGMFKTFLVRLVVVQNHQNGKDTHVRALKLLSPVQPKSFEDSDEVGFTSLAFLSQSQLR